MRVLTFGLIFLAVFLSLSCFVSDVHANLIDKSFSKGATSIIVDVNLSTYVDSRQARSAFKNPNPSKLHELLKAASEFPFSQGDIQSGAVDAVNGESEKMRGVKALIADPKNFQNYLEGIDLDKIYVLIEAEFFPSDSIEPNLNHDVIVVSFKKNVL